MTRKPPARPPRFRPLFAQFAVSGLVAVLLVALAAATGIFLSLAAAAPVVALAKNGADDPATHINGGGGADNPAGDTRGGDDGPNHR